MAHEEKGYEVDPITRGDLDKALDRQLADIKEHLDLKMEPIVKDLDGHARTLYGKSGSNGLSGTVTVLKWGYGLLIIAFVYFVKKFSG